MHRALIDLLEGGAQAFMACHQGVERVFQCWHVQRAAQTQGGGDVVGGAGGIQLPEEPLALLGKRQRDELELTAHFGDRQVGGRDAFGQHFFQVQRALVQGQGDETLGDSGGDALVHYSCSISSSSASSLLNFSVSNCPPLLCSSLTNAPRVGN